MDFKFKFLKLPDRFRQRVYHRLDAIQRVRLRATNRKAKREVDAVPYTVTRWELVQEYTRQRPLMAVVPNVCSIVMTAKNLKYEVIFVVANNMRSIVARKLYNGTVLGMVHFPLNNLHAWATSWAIKMLTQPGMHFEFVNINTLWPPQIPIRQCSVDRLVITQGVYCKKFSTVGDWLMLFATPITELTISTHYHYSNGLYESEQLQSAKWVHIEGISDLLPSIYAKLDPQHFTHLDPEKPGEAIIEALFMQYYKFLESENWYFKYVGQHWESKRAEELLQMIQEKKEKNGLIISRSPTMLSVVDVDSKKKSKFILYLHYDEDATRSRRQFCHNKEEKHPRFCETDFSRF